MKHLKLFFALFAMLALGVGNAWAEETVVYTLTPASGSNNSYANNCDITISDITWNLTGNSQTQPWRIGGKSLTKAERTLYSKTAMQHKVTKVEVSHGTASSITVNSFKLIVASDADFSNVISTVDGTFKASSTATLECPTEADWSNAYYKFVYNVTVSSTSNKYLQFSEAKFYGEASTTPGEGGGEDPVDPTPGTDPEPSTGSTGTINFNSSAVKINDASVTGDDNLGNTWTVTTAGTTSFTSNNAYYQVGSSSKPATTITFTTTLPQEGTITAFSAKFGGFSNTAGTVTLKVDETSVGTGSLSGTTDVVVENSSEATGKTLTVTVTGIAKGVKVYYISYTYTPSGSGSEEPVVLLIPKNGYFEGLLLVQLLALFLQQKDSFSATLQVPPCTRW